MREATGAIDENPFLTETSRVGRGKRVLEQAQSSINNKLQQVQQLTDLYNTGIGEINSMISRTTTDTEQNRALNQAKLNYMLKKVETQVADQGAKAVNANLASYLSGVTLGEAPNVVGSASTGYYQYDRTTGKYVRLGGASGGSSGGSGSGTGTESGSGTTVKSYEEFKNSAEAKQIISEYEQTNRMSLDPRFYDEILKPVYDEAVKNSQTSAQFSELKNLSSSEKSDLQQAGLASSTGNAQSFFINSDTAFRNLIKQGVALGEIPQGLTLQELKDYYDAWKETDSTSSSASKRTP